MKRFRLIAGLAGTTLCLFAISGYAQNTNTPGTTTDPGATGTVSAPQTGTDAGAVTGAAQTPAPTSTGGGTVTGTETRSTATDATTTTSTTSFPGGVLGILAVAVLILLVLFALFRGRDRTVVRESTSSATAAPSGRVTGSSATADDRVATSRAASGTGTTSGGMNDPNARR
jgi:hypothetical protein